MTMEENNENTDDVGDQGGGLARGSDLSGHDTDLKVT